MKVLIIVWLAVLISGVTPAFAAVEVVPDQTVVGGDIIDVPLVLSKQDKNDTMSKTNIEVLNRTNHGLKTYNTKNLTAFGPIVKFDTTGVIMQSTSYNCGSAALATVLNNLGINTTEQELAILAGTDESGTTMYGLVQAAQSKGVNATGVRLSVNKLKKNDIVVLIINEVVHYSVISKITFCGVKLSYPSLGNIIISKKEFKKIYSGNAIVINNLNSSVIDLSNLTENKTPINSSNLQLDDKILKNEDMQGVRGKDWITDAKNVATTTINTICAISKKVINSLPKDDPTRSPNPSKNRSNIIHA